MTKSKTKIFLNGVEITSSLSFTGWNPGFEYTKNLYFKNLNTKTVKVTYNIPQTKYFTTLFPKVISLSPGTTFTLPITFRPLSKVNYEDEIELNQLDFQKTFKIKLIANLPQYKIDFQDALSLGDVCVNDIASSTIKITNKSDLDTLFEWDVKEPFSVSPINGELKANESAEITFTFHPTAAQVFKGSAICRYGGEPLANSSLFKPLELNANGKYPHLLIENENTTASEIMLNFNEVFYGQHVTRYFTIVNMTEVKTEYSIEKNPDVPTFDRCFNCLQHMGTLGPFEKQKIPITYTPNFPNTDQVFDYFTVYTPGKLSKNSITCVAKNEVPTASIENNFIHFGLCNLKNKVARTFNLKNHTDCEINFHFETDNDGSSFKFSQTNGTLLPKETKLIQVLFIPQYPIIYYKKIPCLISDHNVLFIELAGTCHSEEMKPAEISKKHIEQYYVLKRNGFLTYSPEQLAETTQVTNLLKSKTSYDNRGDMNPNEEYLNHPDDSCVAMEATTVDFGASKTQSLEQPIVQEKSITIFNKTKSKLMIFWNTSEHQTFSIHPQTCEIPAMKSYSLRIKFDPSKPDQFYNYKLEGYALYKSLIDYTLTEPKYVLPSWCLNIDCLGHTFHPSVETFFLPKYTTDSENVIFPVSIKDKPNYRTFVVKNKSADYPLIYNFNNLANNEFIVKPSRGAIKKNEHQVFILKFAPKTDSYVVDKYEIVLNYMPKHILEIGLVGGGVLPLISMENNGILYFPPTCKNNNSYQIYEVTNQTRSKIDYEWRIPYECKNLFSVNDVKGTLKPYERYKFLWRFSPQKLEKFNHKVALMSWIDPAKQNAKTTFLRILGSCANGSIQALEMYKDFGNIIVGSSVSSELVLINNNDCDMDFELFVKQSTDENVFNKSYNGVLELDEFTGRVKARSRHTIRCRLRPTKLTNYQFTIEYKIVYLSSYEDNLETKESPTNQREILCYMTANGVYPKLTITDIKGLGSASSLSKDYIWKILSIKELNTSMSCEPNPDELVYSIATRQEANRRLTGQNNKPIIEMNFNAAPINSDDTQVILFIENSGLVPTDWVLLFPKDLLLELEYWAQSGDYEIDELEEMKVQDNKLFTIEPKKGHLEPGEIIRVKITYKHLFSGINKLPVLLKIAKGREIMLNFIGTTVPNNEPHVYFPSSRFEFEPVEIGLMEYPIQIYELYNGGDVPAEVEIDSSFLDELNQENYSRPILKCLTESTILIPPGACFETKWKFSPVEPKTYEVEVLFKVNKVKFNAITFKCIGYDKRKLNNVIIGNKNTEIPEKQILSLPNQLASLTMDRIVLGDVPLFTRERKIIFVRNNSSEHKISFTWHVTNPDHIRFIRIQPSRGIVDTNQNKMCKLTFISKNKPSFYNIDLICEIKNETDMDGYRQDLELWKAEQTRQFQEFVIDEAELENRLKGISKNIDLREKKNDKLMGSQLAIHRFKTIPPIIRNNQLEETNLDRVRRLREEKKQWKKPLPPTPFLLHLNILARTQYIDEFLEINNKIKNNSEKFVDPLLGFGADSNLVEESPNFDGDTILCNDEENSAIEFIFSDLLRNLISDKDFHSLVQRIKDEEVPYFFQFEYDTDKTKNHSAKEILDDSKIFGEKTTKGKSKKGSKSSAQNLKTTPAFSSLIESVLENTISNILTEAFNKEFSLTSRPRLIALPPKTNHTTESSSHNVMNLNTHHSNVKSKTNIGDVNGNAPASPVLSLSSTDII